MNIVPYLVAYWRLDETSGTVAHEESRENHATLNNGPVWTEGKINGALSFDGVDDYLDCGDADALGPEQMTLSMWLRPAQIDRWQQQYGFRYALVTSGAPFDRHLEAAPAWRLLDRTPVAALYRRDLGTDAPVE